MCVGSKIIESQIMFQVPAPNYTQTPNDLIDKWLPHLKEVELKVLLVIIRKTIGWHKQRDRISRSQLSQITGCPENKVGTATKSLQEKGLIQKIVIGKNGNQQTYYELVINEVSNNLDRVQSGPPTGSNLDPTKETLTKEKEKILRTKKPKPDTPPAKPKSHSPSPPAREVCQTFFSSLKNKFPHLKEPDLDKWTKTFEAMLTHDKRNIEEINILIAWVYDRAGENWWAPRVLSAEKFRKQFDTLLAQYNETGKAQERQKRIDDNRTLAQMWKETYPKQFGDLEIRRTCVINKKKGKDLSCDMDRQLFAQRLEENLADGRNV